jgi:hypothetical protein
MKRRTLLQIVGAAPFASALACVGRAPAGFLDDKERTAMARLADLVLPPDDKPGGADLGVVDYVDGLLSGAGLFFASGPFSGRTPLPDASGTATTEFPHNDFAERAPLDRVQRVAWHRMLFGHDEDVGLRALFRKHLAHVHKDTTLDDLDPAFLDVVVQVTYEGAFAPPEYGGNPSGLGWQMVGYEGDRMPFGFANYDEVNERYVEDPRFPVSKKNPGKDPEPFDDTVKDLLSNVVGVLGGRENR